MWAISGIRYVLRNSKEFLEDFEKDYKLYGESCITMYGFDIQEMTIKRKRGRLNERKNI